MQVPTWIRKICGKVYWKVQEVLPHRLALTKAEIYSNPYKDDPAWGDLTKDQEIDRVEIWIPSLAKDIRGGATLIVVVDGIISAYTNIWVYRGAVSLRVPRGVSTRRLTVYARSHDEIPVEIKHLATYRLQSSVYVSCSPSTPRGKGMWGFNLALRPQLGTITYDLTAHNPAWFGRPLTPREDWMAYHLATIGEDGDTLGQGGSTNFTGLDIGNYPKESVKQYVGRLKGWSGFVHRARWYAYAHLPKFTLRFF